MDVGREKGVPNGREILANRGAGCKLGFAAAVSGADGIAADAARRVLAGVRWHGGGGSRMIVGVGIVVSLFLGFWFSCRVGRSCARDAAWLRVNCVW